MTKSHFCFATSFFVLSISATLLLTWTAWWTAVVGSSLPARRPFFRPTSAVPELVQQVSDVADEQVFVYSLPGAWPTSNSIVRFIASVLAVTCSFSFALIASLLSVPTSRSLFSITLLLTAIAACVAAVLDALSIRKAASECSNRACVTAVPQQIIDSGNLCQCSVDGWFYFTLAVDIVLCISALLCLALTLRKGLARRSIDASYTQ